MGYAKVLKDLSECGSVGVSATILHIVGRYNETIELPSRMGYVSALTHIAKNGCITTLEDVKTLFKFIIE